MSATSTEIVPAFTAGRLALREGSKTLAQVAETLLEPVPDHVPSKEVAPFPDVPQTKVLTEKEKEALLALPTVFGKVVVETRRSLQEQEIAAVAQERDVLKTIVSVLAGREAVVNEYIRHHVDVDAEERGVAVRADVIRGEKVIVEATPRDADGHYILASKGNPTRVHIPNTNEDFSLEYRAGRAGSVTIDSHALLDLYEAGEITREQYLALTVERRVFDEAKATAAVIKDESLLEVIAKISRRTGETKPGTSLYVRKAK